MYRCFPWKTTPLGWLVDPWFVAWLRSLKTLCEDFVAAIPACSALSHEAAEEVEEGVVEPPLNNSSIQLMSLML